MRQPLIVGNWKMHGDGIWLDRVDAIAAAAESTPAASVALCVPATLINRAATRCPSLAIGAQDCHADSGGAHTGGVSAAMLRESGARWVIVGHSERRAVGDDDSMVAAKIVAARSAKLAVILCVGESAAERASGEAIAAVSRQLAASLPPDLPQDLVVAYEPVWAIGRGRPPAAEDVAPVIAVLRRELASRNAETSSILYGGSVDATAAAQLMSVCGIDGLLVGTASLDPASFAAIIVAALHRDTTYSEREGHRSADGDTC